ncbi:hypothetical protein I553_8850 [Mycobacterium xenopi 4042]|uniref:Uncharacterized protein n=1 Tax=Mycobacterium xenopi 4042 TaxID=1299334 RepID=X8CLW3_MYCXE|nr:hypothetical protein I553_8850 [Mycobacterium xenopi 4042]
MDPSSRRWCRGVVIGSAPSTASSAPPARAQVLRMRSAVVGAVLPELIRPPNRD